MNHTLPHPTPSEVRREIREFPSFCRDVDFLPRKTPLFVTDRGGKIVVSKSFRKDDGEYPVLSSLVQQDDLVKYIKNKEKCTCAVLTRRNSGGKRFVVVMPSQNGFSRCVVCCCDEQNYTCLSEYYQNMCTYFDYLCSFDSLSSFCKTPGGVLAALSMIKSGANLLLSLSSNPDSKENTRLYGSITDFLLRLKSYIQASTASKVIINDITHNENTVVLSLRLIRMLFSCSALVIRKSNSGILNIDVQRDEQYLNVTLHTTSDENSCFDVYEHALIKAMRLTPGIFNITDKDGNYSVCITLETAAPTFVTIAEGRQWTSALDLVFDSVDMQNMLRLVSDNIQKLP